MDDEIREILEAYREERGHTPSNYESLAADAPKVLKSYWQYRSAILEGVIPRKFKELILVALNIVLGGNGEAHAVTAVRMGATRQELLETILLTNLVVGTSGYLRGVNALKAADEMLQAAKKE
jgi:alkylhydroperoxidase/carboxymuconolactone decarboxylase family protein YurZ